MSLELQNIKTRQDVFAFEKIMQDGEKIHIETKHCFTKDGIYVREIFIPKGVILTSHIHKYDCISIMSSGELDILIDGNIKNIKAPCTFVAPAGVKRIARSIQDTVFITVHRTDETNIERIEDLFVAKSEEDYLEFLAHTEQLKLPV